jgi:hypothetical protein
MKPLKIACWYAIVFLILFSLYYFNAVPMTIVARFRVAKPEIRPIPKTGVYLFGDCLAYYFPRPFTPRYSIPGVPAKCFIEGK